MSFSSFSVLPLLVTPGFVTIGDWSMWRHNTHLTAYQPLPGTMKSSPEMLGKYFLGAGTGAVTPADLSGIGIEQEFLIVARARLFAYDAEGKKLWECNPLGYCLQQVAYVADLDGDGRNEVVALAGNLGGTRWAFLVIDGQTGKIRASFAFNQGQFGYSRFCGEFVSESSGQQILLVTSGRQAAQGGWETHGHIMLLQFDGETISPLWDLEPVEYAIEYPATLIGDLANRGRLHAVVNSWCHVWNIDLSSGKLASHTNWNPEEANQRHYGWNQLVDVLVDGRLDFVSLALTKHVDVLRCDEDGKLSLAWTRGWPDPVTTEARSLACPADPIVDIDSDGDKELIVGVFDGLADNRWHLFAYDGATGELKGEVLDLVPLASVPILGDSDGEAMFCVRSTTNAREPGEGYEVWYLREGQWEQLWASKDEQFLLTGVSSDERLAVGFNGLNVRRAVTADVDSDGRMEFFTQKQEIVQAWGLDDEGKVIKKTGQPHAPIPGPTLPSLPQLEGRMATYLLAADVRGSGRNHLLLYDNINVTELILEGNSLRRGFTLQSVEMPIICQLLGDERQFILLAGREPDQNLFVEARQIQSDAPDASSILWHFTLPDSQSCGQYMQAIYFTVGHFTGGEHLDVFTYSTKPGARTYVLNGLTGQPLWERDEIPGIERHFQAMGGRTAVWDYDGDGQNEFLFGGQDGNLYVYRDSGDHPEQVWRKEFDAPVGTPLLADINSDGKSEIIVSVGDGNIVVLG